MAEKKDTYNKIPEMFYKSTVCGALVNGVPRFTTATNSMHKHETFTANVYKMSSITLLDREPQDVASSSISAPTNPAAKGGGGRKKSKQARFPFGKPDQSDVAPVIDVLIFLELEKQVQVEYSAVVTWPILYVPCCHVVVTRDRWGVIASLRHVVCSQRRLQPLRARARGREGEGANNYSAPEEHWYSVTV